jgi:hypothetical protein
MVYTVLIQNIRLKSYHFNSSRRIFPSRANYHMMTFGTVADKQLLLFSERRNKSTMQASHTRVQSSKLYLVQQLITTILLCPSPCHVDPHKCQSELKTTHPGRT